MHYLILFFFLFQSFFLSAQTSTDEKIRSLGYTPGAVILPDDTVHYLILSSEKELNEKRPLLIFCQGSLPVPVIAEDSLGIYPPLPFSLGKMKERYHVVVISKPGIPLYARTNSPGNQYLVNGMPPVKYMQNDQLPYYASAANAVIRKLRREKFVNRKKLVLMGHSQGYRVAARIAATNKAVTHLVLLSANPYSRYDADLARLQFQLENDSANAPFIRAEMDSVKKAYQEMLAGKDTSLVARNWRSFNTPSTVTDMEKLKIPILVMYGTADIGARDNERLPMRFDLQHKNNLELKAWPALDHNFFGTRSDGSVDYSSFHWNEVALYALEWVERN